MARLCLRSAARVPVLFAHEITAVSQTLQSFYEKSLRRRPTFVPTGVELFDPLPPGRIREFGLEGNDYLFFAGRFVREKGCHLLLDAYERLDTDKRLVIAGAATHDDPYSQSLLERANDRVIFVGHARGELLQELFSNAYLFVQPSLLEGMPVAVLEALSYGRCVVASDIAGNVEALNGHGFTFTSGNSQDLANRLQALVADQQTVAAHGLRAREYIRRERSWERTVDGLEAAYRRALRQPQN
jgi:glycosyltransferase involved in cell wall biosynthesis